MNERREGVEDQDLGDGSMVVGKDKGLEHLFVRAVRRQKIHVQCMSEGRLAGWLRLSKQNKDINQNSSPSKVGKHGN